MISVLLATTGRPEMARQCVEGIHATVGSHAVEVVAAVDADRETEKELRPIVDKLLYSDEYRGCSNAWNDCLAAAAGDPVVLAADDLVWGEGWLDAALATLAGFEDGWGFVGFNDGHWTADLSTHYLVSRRLIVEAFGGVIAWPHYKHSFNDVEASERAKAIGRYLWCKDCYVPHRHWTWGDRPKDETDDRNLAEYEESKRIFNERKAAGFPNDFEAVI